MFKIVAKAYNYAIANNTVKIIKNGDYTESIRINKFPTMKTIADFVKEKRNEVNLTQEDFAVRAGVALTVIRKIEQGKENLNLEKVNQVLKMFGHTLAPVNARELSKSED